MKYNRWEILQADERTVGALREGGFSPLAARVLAARGLNGAEAAREALSCSPELLGDPMLLRDMDRAVARIRQALRCGESVAVYGDYDVDGITATCLMLSVLRALGLEAQWYIPERFSEGYDLNPAAVKALADRGVTLLITVDCGVTACEEVEYAASLGLDVIVTDHHECKETLPCARAVVNPRRPDCAYPYKQLAGVGVAFKVATALLGPERAMEFIDFAAVGAVADVMPMTGENRAIVRMGLDRLETRPRVGFAKILEEAGIARKRLNTMDIGFSVAPRINAAGRMGSAGTAVRLLLTDDARVAERLVAELAELNRLRQATENEIYMSARERIGRDFSGRAIVLADDGWHQGVVGIVASRLAEEYRCRAFLISLSGPQGKASCRGWGGQSLISAMRYAENTLEGYGGHEMAAGFTIKRENIPEFTRLIEEYASGEDMSARESGLKIDCVPARGELNLQNVEALCELEPCGQENLYPVLALEDAVVEKIQEVGGGRHLKFVFSRGGEWFDGIFFSVTRERAGVRRGDHVDVAFSPRVNEFRGERTVQLYMCDIRAHEAAPVERRAAKSADLFGMLMRGERLSRGEAALLTPTRGEFVRLWRAINENRLPPDPSQRELVCLRAFLESGLVRAAPAGFEAVARAEKVSLDETPIMRRLRVLAENTPL